MITLFVFSERLCDKTLDKSGNVVAVSSRWWGTFFFSCSTFVGQKKPNDDAGTSHSETSKKRKVFQKVETSCIAVHCAVLKDSNGLPSASMTERLAESMDLTKRQVIKMIKFSPFGLDIFTLFSSSSIHPAFIWWVFSPVWVTKRLENNFWILTSLDKPHT